MVGRQGAHDDLRRGTGPWPTGARRGDGLWSDSAAGFEPEAVCAVHQDRGIRSRSVNTHMKSLAEQLGAYSAYHHDPRNTLTHFVGVPLVIFGLFVPLAWL